MTTQRHEDGDLLQGRWGRRTVTMPSHHGNSAAVSRTAALALVTLLVSMLPTSPATADTAGTAAQAPAGAHASDPAGSALPGVTTTHNDTTVTLAQVRDLSPACFRAPAQRFLDVFSVHRPGVDCIGWWGVTTGNADGRYEPRRPVRREQMASFIDRTLTLAGIEPPAASELVFDDLVGGVHDDAIARLTALGVVGGVAADRFDPLGTVNRAQMASFLARAYAARTGEDLPIDPSASAADATFSDIVGNVHADNIVRIAAAGLTGGVDGDRFDPGGAVTRAQMGTFLARFLALLVDEGALTYPPADPVPHPQPFDPDDPFAALLDPPITPVPGDALPGAGSAGPTRVPETAPAMLASIPVDLAPGDERRLRVALTSPLADVVYWLDTGPARASFAGSTCPEPGGRGIGLAAGITTTYGDARLSVRHEPDGDGCLRGGHGGYPFARIHNGEVVEIVIDNTGTERFRSQLHVGQVPIFTPMVHPPGSSGSYLFDTTQIDAWVRDLPPRHPLRIWRNLFEVEQGSRITIVQEPFDVGGTEFCPDQRRLIPVESLDPTIDEGGLVRPEHQQSPGRCEMRLETQGAVRISMNVGVDNRMIFEVEPNS